MTLAFGEVVLIRMQFHQARGAKIRQALVLLDARDDDFVAAPITSQSRHTDYDLMLGDRREAGLNVVSCVRVHELTVLAKTDVARSVGMLSDRDGELVRKVLCRVFCPRVSVL